MNSSKEPLYQQAISLLQSLIATPSISKEEGETANILNDWFAQRGIEAYRVQNNVWAKNQYFNKDKKTLLLLSHHDTVKPADGYSFDPFKPFVSDDRLYGLGSNDAGGPLVTLMVLFSHLYARDDLPFNIVICAAAEEEISGKSGIELALTAMPPIDFAIVGEPTGMQAAISEKGLMVCDCVAYGQAGHAARDEGVNAINIAMKDIEWLNNFQFPKVSPVLGPVKMTASVIQGGVKHNVVPEQCHFIVDVRTTDAYSNAEVLSIMQSHMQSSVIARSTRLNPSYCPPSHPMVQLLKEQGVQTFGSVTMSDQALLSCPSIKFSPGESARSHTADEYIGLDEIKQAIDFFESFFEITIKQEALI